MHKRICLVVLACAVFAASGCDTVKPYWKSTKSFYKSYINTDPVVTMKDDTSAGPSERKLADLLMPVDARLEYLLRTISSQDVPPDADWCRAFLNIYPWVSGVAVLDPSGAVVQGARVSPKEVSFEPLRAFDKRFKDHQMAAAVVANDLGNEVLLGKPLSVDGEDKGLLVVYFDPANLAKFSPDPGSLIMFIPGAPPLIVGDVSGGQALAGQNWKSILASNVSGEMTAGGTSYLWQSRYVAQLNLVYAVARTSAPAKGVKPVAPNSAPPAAQSPQPATQSPSGAMPQEVVQPSPQDMNQPDASPAQ